jgi:hypothetical protein
VNGRWVWEWNWRRDLSVWKQGFLSNLLQEIGAFSLQQYSSDDWWWREHDLDSYSVKSAYHVAYRAPMDRLLLSVWHSKAPSKVKAFAW